MTISDPLVSADWLKQTINAPNLKIVDATWIAPFLNAPKTGRQHYDDAHVPGAVFFDIDEIADQATDLSHMLPAPEQFARQVGALGLASSDHIIVYDSNKLYASARVWWMFRTMGHDRVQVLDGGLAAWQRSGGAVASEAPASAPAQFTPGLRRALVRDLGDMRTHIGQQDAAILDARAEGRFNGTQPEPRAGLPSGHMPGSICVAATRLHSADGVMKSTAELAEMLAPFQTGQVITSCGSGVSAAIISLALARLGNWDAALYDGSWSEWAASPDNPIVKAP